MLRSSLFKDYVCCGESVIGNLNTRFNKDLTVCIWVFVANRRAGAQNKPLLVFTSVSKVFSEKWKKKKNWLGWVECKSWGKCRNLGPKWSNADRLTFSSFTVWTNRFPIIPAGWWVSDSLIMSEAPHRWVSASRSHFVTCRIIPALINLPQVLLMPFHWHLQHTCQIYHLCGHRDKTEADCTSLVHQIFGAPAVMFIYLNMSSTANFRMQSQPNECCLLATNNQHLQKRPAGVWNHLFQAETNIAVFPWTSR